MCNNLNQFSLKSNSCVDVSSGGLGNYIVKLRAKPKTQCKPKTIITPDIVERLHHKFELLRKSQKILRCSGSKNVLQCMRGTVSDFVEVEKSDGHANFYNIVTCKSKWVCPVESPSIAAVEARYIQEAIYKCRKEDNDVYMFTVTYRHHKRMSLQYSMQKMHDALEVFWRNGSVRRFHDNFFFSRITSQELTWSEQNGWHPHEHILLFGERGLQVYADSIGRFLDEHWLHSLEKVGLTGEAGIASNFQSGSAIKDYLTKMPLELTLSNCKKGRAGGLNPFGILEFADPDDSGNIYNSLWDEYYSGTKGKKVLFWGRGLKARYGIEEKTDEEIADEANEDLAALVEGVLMFVDSKDWRQKVCADPYNLAYLKTCSVEDAAAMLDSLGCFWGV